MGWSAEATERTSVSDYFAAVKHWQRANGGKSKPERSDVARARRSLAAAGERAKRRAQRGAA